MSEPPIESLTLTFPFFILGVLGMISTGILMFIHGGDLWVTHWAPGTVAMLHALTLGFIALTMMGALIQVSPVVGGCRMVAPKAAYFEQVAIATGGFSLVYALLEMSQVAAGMAMFFLGLGFGSFALRALLGQLTTESKHPSVRGMRIALLALIGMVVVGILMAKGYAGYDFPGMRGPWMQLHMTFAVLGWIGALMISVGWQVLPMFYLTPDPHPDVARMSSSLVLLGLAATLGAFTVGVQSDDLYGHRMIITFAAAPAAIAVWIIEPIGALLRIRDRKRKRKDGSLLGWILGLSMGIATFVLVIVAIVVPKEPIKQLVAWVALWGWASLIIHAMLYRIVPFLIWYSRFSEHVGTRKNVPSMRKLLPDITARRGVLMHFGTTFVGAAAILFDSGILFQVTGALIITIGMHLGLAIFGVLRARVPAA